MYKHCRYEVLVPSAHDGATCRYTSSANQQYFNILVNTPLGSMFKGLVVGEADIHDAKWIAGQIGSFIERIGPELIDLVIQDNAPVCVAAGKLLEKRFPKITSMGCCAHALDLVMKDACKHEWAAKLITSCRQVVTFFKARQLPYRLFREQSPERTLLLPGATRFASNLIMMERFLDVRPALKRTVLSDSFQTWAAKQPHGKSKDDSLSKREKVESIVTIIEDNELAKNMKDVVNLLVPVVKVLRMCDSNQPCAGFLYQAMSDLSNAFDAERDDKVSMPFRVALGNIVNERWNFLHNDWLSAAYILNPRYWHIIDEICDIEEVWQGFLNIVTKLANTPQEAATALNEFNSLYRSRAGSFAGPVAEASSKMDTIAPHAFWQTFGHSAKTLKPMAIRITSKSAASSACETNWSNVDFILSKRRTKLSNERVGKLLSIYSNNRVARKLQARTGDEEYYNWAAPDAEEPCLSDATSDSDED